MRAVAALLLIAAALLPAQSPLPTAPPGALDGTVFDSLHASPLAGALVALEGTPLAARTDARGRFTFDSLPAGRYLITAESDALDSLGVAVPGAAVDVAAGRRGTVTLGVPSRATLLALACRGIPLGDDGGVLLGVVRDAAGSAPVAGATVTVSWQVWTLAGVRMVSQPASVTAATAANGVFRACGVPAGAPVRLRAAAAASASPARSSGEIEVRIADFGIARHDLMLGAPGEGVVRGTVTGASGAPLAGARAQIAGDTAFALSDSSGAFHLANAPSGTRMLDVRRVGSAPAALEVELRAGAPATVTVTLHPAAQLLSAVTVHGSPGSPAAGAEGFDARKQRGIGHFVDRQQIESKGDVEVAELLRGVPGMEVRFSARGTVAVWVRSATGCAPRYYLDGTAVDARSLPHANEIENLEVYAPSEVPPAYAGAKTSCAVVLLWLRRAGSPAPAPAPAPDSGSATR